MQECATAARDDFLPSIDGLVALVVVQIAGEPHRDGSPENLALDSLQRGIGVLRLARITRRIDPLRTRHADDDVRVGGHLRGDIDEIFFLRLIDLRTELQIDRQQPPITRQSQCEITAGLPGLAAGEAARGSAERA